MANIKSLLMVGVLAVTLQVTIASAQNWKAGTPAPAFSGLASDGKTYSLSSIKKSGKPTLLYFIGHTCPVNAQAVKYYNRVANAYKGKVNFLGVIDTDRAGYDNWQRTFKSPFTVILDPQLKIINAYKAERSPWTILIDKTGKISHEWPGYSTGEINELSRVIARVTKATVAKIDTSGAPESPRYG